MAHQPPFPGGPGGYPPSFPQVAQQPVKPAAPSNGFPTPNGVQNGPAYNGYGHPGQQNGHQQMQQQQYQQNAPAALKPAYPQAPQPTGPPTSQSHAPAAPAPPSAFPQPQPISQPQQYPQMNAPVPSFPQQSQQQQGPQPPAAHPQQPMQFPGQQPGHQPAPSAAPPNSAPGGPQFGAPAQGPNTGYPQMSGPPTSQPATSAAHTAPAPGPSPPQNMMPSGAPRPMGMAPPGMAPPSSTPSQFPQRPVGPPQPQFQSAPQPSFPGQPQMPQMGGGPPQMGVPGGPPQPQMGGPLGPPQMGGPGGPPQMGVPGGPPQMGGPGGPPQMGMAGPQMGGPGGPPQMGMGAPQMGGPGGPPQMGMGAPQMGGPMAGAPQMGGAFPPGPAGYPAGPGGFPGGMPQPQRQRLDPNMMPSAVQVREDDAVRTGLFPTGFPHAEHPPLVTTEYFAQDQGNCNPRFMRSTIYVAPQTQELLKHSQIPFAVSISPFAKLTDKERPPPIVDLGPQGPIRCQRCKAYMCPFMEFQDGGRRFRCPFCHASTPVEDAYFAHLDHTGRRTDIEYRPELQFGTYEFVATRQYCKNGVAPKEPAFIFMVDVSYNAIQSGMLQTLCNNLEQILQHLPRELGAQESAVRVGLATFDQAVHFYDLSSPTPNMMVVGDVNEMFVPCVDGLLLPYTEAAPAIKVVLQEIMRLFSQSRTTETMLGPVVQAGLDALKCADRAGKLFVFSSSLPVMEAPGKLKNRDDRKLLGTDKEKSILTPQSEFYTKLGEQCVKFGCTVDLFLFPNAFIDVATLGQLTAVTGGSVHKYQYFDASKDSSRFLSDLHHDVSRQIAFDCMVRVRSSAGIRPVKFHGSFFMENTTDMEIASIDEDKGFIVELKHDDKLTDQLAVIQAACLFTSCSGQRRLRIINLCLPVTSDYNHMYRVADQDTLSTYLLKIGVEINREKGLKDTKEQMTNRVAHMLAAYREKCSEQAPLGQLILPETLKILPCFVNSILKSDAIAAGSEMTVDDKAWLIELIRGMKVEDAVTLIYPRVFPVSGLELNDPSDVLTLPAFVRASTEYLKNDTAFLIDNGVCIFLWIGLGVAQEWVHDVFGVNAVTLIDTETHAIPEKDNAKSRALRRCIELTHTGPRKRKVFVIREKDALEPWMKKFLVEDKSGPNGMTYVDYLCYIHREIRNILS